MWNMMRTQHFIRELLIRKKRTCSHRKFTGGRDDELLDDAAADDKKLLEARMIAKRIKELMGTQKVTDKQPGNCARCSIRIWSFCCEA